MAFKTCLALGTGVAAGRRNSPPTFPLCLIPSDRTVTLWKKPGVFPTERHAIVDERLFAIFDAAPPLMGPAPLLAPHWVPTVMHGEH